MNKLLQGDCLELLKGIPDGAVDMILTDLPFGITDCEFDRRIPLEPMWAEFKRVTKKNAAIALFSQMPFGAELIMSNKKMFRYEWIWHKNIATGFLNAKKMPLKCHENILIFYQTLPTYNPQYWYGKPWVRIGNNTNTRNYRACRDGGYNRNAESPDGHRYPQDVQKFRTPYGGGVWGQIAPATKTNRPVGVFDKNLH